MPGRGVLYRQRDAPHRPGNVRCAVLSDTCILAQLCAKCNSFTKNKCAFRAAGREPSRVCALIMPPSCDSREGLILVFVFVLVFVFGIPSMTEHAQGCSSMRTHGECFRFLLPLRVRIRFRFCIPFPFRIRIQAAKKNFSPRFAANCRRIKNNTQDYFLRVLVSV